MFTYEDKVLIKHYRLKENYGRKKLLQKFPEKHWTPGGLDALLRKIDSTGSFARRPGSGRPKSVRTHKNIEKVEDLILSQENKPSTHKTPRQISQMTKIHLSSVRRIIKHDLKLKPFKKIKGQKLTALNKEKRVVCAKKLLRKITDQKLLVTFFTDEKIFTIDPPMNTQNRRVYGKRKKFEISDERLYVTKEHFPKSVMVSLGVSMLGKTSLVFVQPKAKVNADYYVNNILHRLLPDMRNLANNGHFIFQQDGARAHTANTTIQFLNENVPELISPDFWPPNSPDLNPVDYFIWERLSQMVYSEQGFQTIDELKRVLVNSWENLSQIEIDNSMKEFRKRLKKVIRVNGGHFEHFF